ncbi:CocE/NonD family hydrolase [uncultured Hyphomonas sp.]|uniref:CocE/NonD family hydrolase n=1 Tax=uncultured Hyphomonas sp. TaxID=225298 RepID=UPI002AABDE91|nr:CocE/NonD family hydrolase [uncultured Hyphomonas sp.]
MLFCSDRVKTSLAGASLIALSMLSACNTPVAPGDSSQAESETVAGAEQTPARADKAYYVSMRDGVMIAINLYYPQGKVPAEAAPAILVQTRYGRAGMIPGYERFRDEGYVIASIDTRGSTSSFGPRRVDVGPEEVVDMDEIIAHLAAQPWSNGAVFAQGTSYMADTADVATSRPAPALKGAIIREVDFDVFLNLFFPGGVANDWFLHGWGGATKNMDEGVNDDGSLNCLERADDCDDLWPVLDRVDSDTDFSQLREALAGRNRWAPDDYSDLVYFDNKGRNGFSFFDSSPSSHLDGIKDQAKPAQVWGSWMDGGTARAALSRYLSAPDVPMDIWITANDHPNVTFADPRFPGDLSPRPSIDTQHDIMSGFYDRVADGQPVTRQINYYVLGADTFKQTGTWPPANVEQTAMYLSADNALAEQTPDAGSLSYDVDFTASTGETTRWSTQFGIAPAYEDRAAEDDKLLVFDSAPLETTLELAGDPVVSLYVTSATADPVFHAYLELVLPDGTVSYLTEGVIRAIHRAPADPATLPYDMGAAPHSFREDDMLPVTPGEQMKVEFALNPVAARLNPGERIRLAIAGADTAYFRRYSEGQPENFTVSFGPDSPSRLTLPLRPWLPSDELEPDLALNE